MQDSKNAYEMEESYQYGSVDPVGKSEEDSLLKEAIADTKMQNRWLHRTNLLIGGGLLLLLLVVYGSKMQHEQPTAALANLPKEGDPLTEEEWAKVHEYWAQNPVDFSGVDLPTNARVGCTISPSTLSLFFMEHRCHPGMLRRQ